jgi:trk system potassium uptake protein TrkH
MLNLKFDINIIGRLVAILALFMISTLPWIFHFREFSLLIPTIESITITVFFGLTLVFFTRKCSKEIKLRDSYLIVSLTWIIMGIVGSLPFYLSGSIPVFTDALFESVSGFTTTGSSILTDIEVIPKSILYWRSLTHWIGGMGIVVLAIAILPALKVAGYQLFSMEASGIIADKIKPRTADIAKRLWGIYILLTVVVVVLLLLGGVNLYESLCHAFGTVATGGFSTKNKSVGFYSSYVQYVIMIFMLLSGINFTIHYYLLKGDFKKIMLNSELKAFLGIIFTFGFVITVLLILKNNFSFEQAFRESFFQVVSIITATGFATSNYLLWDDSAWSLIFLLMFVGACIGSTGGGIKVARHVVAAKTFIRLFNKIVRPNLIKPVKLNGQIISDENTFSILSFIFIYLGIFVTGSLAMSFMGLDLSTSLSSVITTMGGIGPGLGSVGPASNFAHIPVTGKVLLTLMMILGRLEIFTLLVLFTPGFWRNN